MIEAIKIYKQNMRYFSRQEEIETELRLSEIDGVSVESKNAIKNITEIPDLGQYIDLYI